MDMKSYLKTVATGITATVNTYLKTEECIHSKATEFLFACLKEQILGKTHRKKTSIYLFCRIKTRRFLFYCSFQRDSISCRCFNDIKTAWLWANILPIFLFNSHFLQISGTAEICHHLDHSCSGKKKTKHPNIKTFLQYILTWEIQSHYKSWFREAYFLSHSADF